VRRAHGIVVGGQERVERALNAFEESLQSAIYEYRLQLLFGCSTVHD